MALGLVLCAAALAAPAPARAEEPASQPAGQILQAQVIQAKEHNQQGKRLFNLGQFKEAATAYDQAYKVLHLPAFLFNLGQCYQRMKDVKDLERAQFYFESYLAKEPEAKNRKEVEEQLGQLERKIETLQDYAKPVLLGVDGMAGVTPAPPRIETPFYKTWWFWTVVGVVAAGAVTGTVVALQPGDNPPVEGSLWPKVVSFD